MGEILIFEKLISEKSFFYRRDGVVVTASALLSVDLGFIL